MLDITGLNSLVPYYTIEAQRRWEPGTHLIIDVPGQYLLTCKACEQQYSLRRGANEAFHGGNILALFDHAIGHKVKKATKQKGE